MARISKRVREEAIEACELLAYLSMDSERTVYIGMHVSDDQLLSVVLDAWSAAFVELPSLGRPITERFRVAYLEAAALLRDGWCPGDPVVLLAEVR